MVLEQEKKFENLVQYDEVDYLSGKGVSVCIVDSELKTVIQT